MDIGLGLGLDLEFQKDEFFLYWKSQTPRGQGKCTARTWKISFFKLNFHKCTELGDE